MAARPIYVTLPYNPDGPEMLEQSPGAGSSSEGCSTSATIPPITFTSGEFHSLEDARKAVNALTRPLGFEVNFSSVKDGKYCNLVCHRHGANGAFGARGTKRPRGTKATGCPFKVNCKLRGGMWLATLAHNTHNHAPQPASELPQLRRERLLALRADIHERLVVRGEAPAAVRSFLRSAGVALSDSAFAKAVADARRAARDAPAPAPAETMLAFTPATPGGNLHTLYIPAAVARALAQEYGSEVAVGDDRQFGPYSKPRGAQRCGYCKEPGHRINQCNAYEERHGQPYQVSTRKRALSASSESSAAPAPAAKTMKAASAAATAQPPPTDTVSAPATVPDPVPLPAQRPEMAGQSNAFHQSVDVDVSFLEQALFDMPPDQAQAYLDLPQGQQPTD
ncbi:unnamed protein product [Cutaneotrichosporon oleaginosum]